MRWFKKAKTQKFETALSRVNDVAGVTAGMPQAPHENISNCTQLSIIASNQNREICTSDNTRNTDSFITNKSTDTSASPQKRTEYHTKEDSLASNGSLTKFQSVAGESDNAGLQVKSCTTMLIPSINNLKFFKLWIITNVVLNI